MKEEGKIEVINMALLVTGILSVFFAGYVIETLFYLSLFLVACGVVVLSVKAVPSNKGDEEE
jgi:hypothetical protein